jgi:hypothetical protein
MGWQRLHLPLSDTIDLSMTDLSFSEATPSIFRQMVLTVVLAGVLNDGDFAGDASSACC